MAKAGLHTAKYLPCVTHGKPRTAYNGRQRATLPWAKSILPCAILHTRQNKVGKRRATLKTSLPCALAQAHGKEWMFAECLCNDTRQRAKRAKKNIFTNTDLHPWLQFFKAAKRDKKVIYRLVCFFYHLLAIAIKWTNEYFALSTIQSSKLLSASKWE